MTTIYDEYAETGLDKSPLDLIETAVLAAPSYYTVRRTVTDVTDGFLTELWVDAINTSSGETFGFIAEYDGTTVTVSACTSIDTGQAIDAQPNLAPSAFSSDNMKDFASYGAANKTFVSIDTDFIYVDWLVELPSTNPTTHQGFFIGTVEKAHTFSGGLTFLVTTKVGESNTNIFYESLWYGDSSAASSNNVMGRVNALHVSGHFPAPIGSPRYFYARVSVHVNTTPFEDSTYLVLLGFLPNNIFGTKKWYQTLAGLTLNLPEGTFRGAQNVECEAIDTLLFQTA